MGIPSHIDSDLIVKDGVMEIDRERAKIFDREAERYDRCRPSYPDELIDEVLGRSPQGLSVLDVATGTGIAASWRPG
jgi:ubiquinone/menaquinone biosynthesis C-methylase UbiE